MLAWIIGVVAVVRRRLPACWGIVLLAAAAAVAPTLAIAFIAQRYLADFVPGLVVGASVGVPVVVAWIGASARRARWSLAVGGTLLVIGLTVNAGLALLARNVYLLPTTEERREFVAAQYRLHGALGGGRPPSVVELDELGVPAADGTIAILGDCDGIYRSDGTEWVPLELRPGGSRRVVVEGDATGPVVSGDGWRIVLERDRRCSAVGVRGAPIASRAGRSTAQAPSPSTSACCRSRPPCRPTSTAGARSTCSPNRRGDR